MILKNGEGYQTTLISSQIPPNISSQIPPNKKLLLVSLQPPQVVFDYVSYRLNEFRADRYYIFEYKILKGFFFLLLLHLQPLYRRDRIP